jgi:hypothetical protein
MFWVKGYHYIFRSVVTKPSRHLMWVMSSLQHFCIIIVPWQRPVSFSLSDVTYMSPWLSEGHCTTVGVQSVAGWPGLTHFAMLVFSTEGHNQSGAALLQICIQPVVMNVKSWYPFFPQGLCSLLLSMVISFREMSTDVQLNSEMSILQNAAAAAFCINVLLTHFCACWGWESPSCQKSYSVAKSPNTSWMLCMQSVYWRWNWIIPHVL